MRKKTASQMSNTGSKRGIAKHKKETLADKVINNIDDSKDLSKILKYPILISGDKSEDKEARQYFDLYIESFKQMDIIFQDQDSILLSMLCQQCVLYNKQIQAALNNPILEEINGNTGQIVKKPNPAVKGSQQTMKLIIATAERLGQTPYSRAKIFEIAATVKALDHTTKNDADKARKSDTIEDWQNIANTLNNKKGVK